jgi:heat shock protein HslJ/membrane-bound inhibitor of C-type lysozyme
MRGPNRIRTVRILMALLLLASASGGSSQTTPPAATSAEGGGLGGTSWQLVKFQGGDGKVQTPDDPTKYTVSFDTDRTVAVRFDCNQGRGIWSAKGAQLELGDLRITRAACPPGSLYDRLARDWTYIRSFVRKDGNLFLALKADAGIYEFAPMAEKPAPPASAVASRGPFTFQCQGASGPSEEVTATFYETKPGLLLLVRAGQTRPAFQAVSGSGAKYEGEGLSYWEAKGEAIVDWSGTELRCKTGPGAQLGGD